MFGCGVIKRLLLAAVIFDFTLTISGGSSIKCRLPACGLVRRIIFGRYRMKGILPDEYVVLAWEQGEAGSLGRFPSPGLYRFAPNCFTAHRKLDNKVLV